MRRGGVLLETVVALAIFVGVGSFVLLALRQANDAAERVLLEARAMDYAASTLAELEAGILTMADLRGDVPVERAEFDDEPISAEAEEPRLRVEADTARTQWDGLVEVTIRVFDTQPPPSAELAERELVVLRQLVATRVIGDEAFEEDDLLRGLPTEREDPFAESRRGGGS